MDDQYKEPYSYEKIKSIAEFILGQTDLRPKIGLIIGSGLSGISTIIDNAKQIPYDNIPDFPVSTVPGHTGQLIIGSITDIPVCVMNGRFHYYEGYPIWICAMPLRVMKLMGIDSVVLTNAAGGLNPEYKRGDVMLLKDHLNLLGLAGVNPLRGPNDETFGPRFPSGLDIYSRKINAKAKLAWAKTKGKGNIHEGVYSLVSGPTYETRAELRFLKTSGVDAVGMSTASEAIVASQCGMKVVAFSLITNECTLEYTTRADVQVTHEEVLESGRQAEDQLKQFIVLLVQEINYVRGCECKNNPK